MSTATPSPAPAAVAAAPTKDAAPPPRILLRLARYVSQRRGLVFASFSTMLVVGGLDLLAPDLVRRAIDGPIRGGSVGGLVGFAIALLVVAGAGSLARGFQQYLTVLTGQRIGQALRQDVFGHLQRMGLPFFDRNPVGTLVTRVTSDVESVEEFFSSGVASVLYDGLKLVFILAWLAWIDGLLALVILAVIPVLWLVTAIFTRRTRRDFRRVRAEVATTNAYTQEAIGGIRVTRLFDRAEQSRQGFRVCVDRLNQAHQDTNFNFAFFFPALDVLQAVSVGLAIAVGAPRILDGSISYGSLAQMILLANLFFEPLRDLSQNFNGLLQAMVSSERVFRLMDTPEQVPDRPDAARVERLSGRVTFEDVRFSYVYGNGPSAALAPVGMLVGHVVGKSKDPATAEAWKKYLLGLKPDKPPELYGLYYGVRLSILLNAALEEPFRTWTFDLAKKQLQGASGAGSIPVRMHGNMKTGLVVPTALAILTLEHALYLR